MKVPLIIIGYAIANLIYDYVMNLFDGMTYLEAWLSLGTYFIMLTTAEYVMIIFSLLVLILSMCSPAFKQHFASFFAIKQRLTAQPGSLSEKGTQRKG